MEETVGIGAGSRVRRYMTVPELAGYLGISKWLIYKYVSDREIPFIPFGRLVRFDRLAVDRWLERRAINAAPSGRPTRMKWNKTGPVSVLPVDRSGPMEADHGAIQAR